MARSKRLIFALGPVAALVLGLAYAQASGSGGAATNCYPGENGSVGTEGEWVYPEEHYTRIHCPLSFVNGETITRLKANYYDDSPYDMTFSLRKVRMSDGDRTTLCWIQTDRDTSGWTYLDEECTSEVVDNYTYVYYLVVDFSYPSCESSTCDMRLATYAATTDD